MQADTLQSPSESLLRHARRQLGEPSDSKVPATEGRPGEPASAARSKPLPAVAEEGAAEEGAAEEAAAGEAAAAPAAEAQAASGGMPSDAVVAGMAKQLAKLVGGFRGGEPAGPQLPCGGAACCRCPHAPHAVLVSTLACMPCCLPRPQDDSKARALLRRMGGDAVRAAVLERLGAEDAGRAAACWALMEEDQAAGGSEQQEQAAEEEEEPEESGEEAAAPAQQRGRGRRRAAAGARRALKRAASAALSDSEATETEPEARWAGGVRLHGSCSVLAAAANGFFADKKRASLKCSPFWPLPACSDDMASSDDDDFQAPRSSRRRVRLAICCFCSRQGSTGSCC